MQNKSEQDRYYKYKIKWKGNCPIPRIPKCTYQCGQIHMYIILLNCDGQSLAPYKRRYSVGTEHVT